jgi:hypothetical protein
VEEVKGEAEEKKKGLLGFLRGKGAKPDHVKDSALSEVRVSTGKEFDASFSNGIHVQKLRTLNTLWIGVLGQKCATKR